MEEALRATTESALRKVSELIHDHWFDVNDVVFDEQRRILSIKFQRPGLQGETTPQFLLFRRRRYPVTEWYLRVARVESYRLEDTQKIQRYDFNDLRYDSKRHFLQIRTGIPMAFEVDVQDLDVTIEDTGRLIGAKTTVTL